MAGVVHLLTSVLGELRRVIEEDRKRHGQLKAGLEGIMNDMEMVRAKIEGYKEYHETRQAKVILQQLQELVYDVDDFVAGLRVRGPSASGLVLTAAGMDPRSQYLLRIDGFRKTIKDLQGLIQTEATTPGSGQGGQDDRSYHSALASGTIARSSSSASPPRYTPSKDLVGIDKPIADLLEMIFTPSSGQNDTRHKLRVISIVGSHGMGKTALARAIYEHPRVSNEFQCVSWVEASDYSYSVDQLWCKVVETLRAETGATVSRNLHGILADKRYLVFIDDVKRADVWKEIVDTFPGNEKGSRIVVTTTVHSVANACSSGSYVFRMQYLGQAESEDLFWRRVYGCPMKPSDNLITGSKGILSKCGGSPLALTSVANYLSIKTKSYCEDVGQNLGRDYLSSNSAVSSFRQLRKVLAEHYNKLPDYEHRTYVLYLSIFPEGHQINKNSLIRKLEAEGLVSKDGYKCFDELIDQCTIDPVLIGSNCKSVNKCLVHGLVLEHIIEMSVSKNFVTLMHKHEKLRKVDSTVARVRRLSIQSSTKERYSDVEDKSAIRSLTIFKSDLFDFQSCKMLRLLDLEGCEGLNKRILHGICDLLLLRYLSLRNTSIHELPSEIKKLQHLETLDIRDTEVKTLPMEVIILPKLAYLFGKFELPKVPKDKRELEQFFRKKSELQTLCGFIISNKQGIGHIVLMARKLTKVKMWCEDTPDPSPAKSSASVPASVSRNNAPDPAPLPAPAPAPAPALNATLGGLPVDASGPRRARSSFFRSSMKKCVPCLNGENQVVQPEPNPPALDAPLQTNNSVSAPNGAVAAATTLTARNAVALDSPSQVNLEDFVSSLEERSTFLDSVSIDSSRLCKDFLGTLKGPSTISSIKLRGQLDGLPDSVTLSGLCNLTKLQLISTGLSSHDLSDLQSLSCLEYLKLAEHRDGFWDGIFIVKQNGFESLHHLCLEAPKLPKLQFKQGAMRSLTSLQLLCPGPPITLYFSASHQLQESVDGILHLTNLNEVILHYSASEAAMQAWKTAANRHINRPCIKKQPKPDNQHKVC